MGRLFLTSDHELLLLGSGTTFTGPLLFLSSLFLQTFHANGPQTVQDIEEGERRFLELLSTLTWAGTGFAEVQFDPLAFMSASAEPWHLDLEIIGLRHALSEWIDKGQKPAPFLDISFDRLLGERLNDALATYYFYKRLLQAPAYPEAYEGQLRRVHESDSFLALAWAEIWYALDFRIRARECPYCSKVFLVPANNPRKNNCLSKACKKRYEIERHGGPEKYRQWEKTRNKSGGVKRGRPRK